MINESQLLAIMPNSKAARRQAYLPFLNAAMAEVHIDTPLRQAAFLAQLALESGELRYMGEVWGPTPQQLKYERPVVDGQPAPLVTPGPKVRIPLWQALGNTEPGDGFRYRGAGPIQLTGRTNFRIYGQALGLDLEGNPDQAHEPSVGFRIAAQYWHRKGLNVLADERKFDDITLAINGGYLGKPQRDAYYAVALKVLGA